MDTSEVYKRQLEVAKRDFPDVVEQGEILLSESGVPLKLRLSIVDGSVVDCFWSSSGKYSYHWDRRAIMGRYIAMTMPRMDVGHTFVRSPSTSITVQKTQETSGRVPSVMTPSWQSRSFSALFAIGWLQWAATEIARGGKVNNKVDSLSLYPGFDI